MTKKRGQASKSCKKVLSYYEWPMRLLSYEPA